MARVFISKKGFTLMSDIFWYIAFIIISIVFVVAAFATDNSEKRELIEEFTPQDAKLAAIGWLRWPLADVFPNPSTSGYTVKNGFFCFPKKIGGELCPLRDDATMADLVAFYFYAKEKQLGVDFDFLEKMIQLSIVYFDNDFHQYDYHKELSGEYCMKIESGGSEIKPPTQKLDLKLFSLAELPTWFTFVDFKQELGSVSAPHIGDYPITLKVYVCNLRAITI